MYFYFSIHRGRKRFVSEGDGGHIKPEAVKYRDWICWTMIPDIPQNKWMQKQN